MFVLNLLQHSEERQELIKNRGRLGGDLGKYVLNLICLLLGFSHVLNFVCDFLDSVFLLEEFCHNIFSQRSRFLFLGFKLLFLDFLFDILSDILGDFFDDSSFFCLLYFLFFDLPLNFMGCFS